jgi:hypothetical protein
MSTVFSTTFLNTKWKTHRENVIFDQERALLPATQPLVENIIRRERITKEIREINEQINVLYNRRDALRDEYNINPINLINNIEQERRIFIRACPDPECRGFLSTQWKCGICEKWTCPTCNEIKGTERDTEHVCNPDQVESVAFMRQDTKPCPNCGMGIFKINGCDQMFCTQCHTAFCWRTGRIQTAIHNPHYFEWLRENNANAIDRNPQDVICGREIDTHCVRNLTTNIERKITAETLDQSRRVISICRMMIHLRRVDMVYYQVNHVLNNQNLRIKYLRNQITEEQLKSNLQKNDKKHQKHREIYDILQMVHTTTTDILYRFLEEIRKNAWNNDFTIIQEIEQLRLYANRCLQEISETYKSIRMSFNDKMEFTRRCIDV